MIVEKKGSADELEVSPSGTPPRRDGEGKKKSRIGNSREGRRASHLGSRGGSNNSCKKENQRPFCSGQRGVIFPEEK